MQGDTPRGRLHQRRAARGDAADEAGEHVARARRAQPWLIALVAPAGTVGGRDHGRRAFQDDDRVPARRRLACMALRVGGDRFFRQPGEMRHLAVMRRHDRRPLEAAHVEHHVHRERIDDQPRARGALDDAPREGAGRRRVLEPRADHDRIDALEQRLEPARARRVPARRRTSRPARARATPAASAPGRWRPKRRSRRRACRRLRAAPRSPRAARHPASRRFRR